MFEMREDYRIRFEHAIQMPLLQRTTVDNESLCARAYVTARDISFKRHSDIEGQTNEETDSRSPHHCQPGSHRSGFTAFKTAERQ